MLNSFCGFRLNTAGVLIGWIGGAFSLMTIVLLALSFGYLDELTEEVFENIGNPNISQEAIRNVLLALIYVYITFNFTNVVSSALLVVGTVKERHLLLVPWLLNSSLALLFSVIYLLFYVIEAITMNATFASTSATLIVSGISLAFDFYIKCAIYSLYKHIQENRDIQQRSSPAISSSFLPYTKI